MERKKLCSLCLSAILLFSLVCIAPALAKSCWHSKDENVRLVVDVWFNWEYAEEGRSFHITMKLHVKHSCDEPIESLALHAILPYEPQFYPVESANLITKVRGNVWISEDVLIEPVILDVFEVEYATCSQGVFESNEDTFTVAHYVFDLSSVGEIPPGSGKGVEFDLVLAGAYPGAYPVWFYATYTIDGVTYRTT